MLERNKLTGKGRQWRREYVIYFYFYITFPGRLYMYVYDYWYVNKYMYSYIITHSYHPQCRVEYFPM